MFVRYSPIAEGPGPSDTMVGVKTSEGHTEEVVISKRQAQNGSIDVGAPLIQDGDRFLIELPRESMAGRWRVWVSRSEIIDTAAAQAAE